MGPDLSWHQGIQALSGAAYLRDVLGLRHIACLWTRYTTQSLPSNTLVQLLSLTTFVYAARRWQGPCLLRCISRYTHSRSSAIDFPAVATRIGDGIGLFDYITFVVRAPDNDPFNFLFEYIQFYCTYIE